MGNNTLEVVLNLVDNLSPAISSASESINALQSAVDAASASLDSIDPSSLNEIASNAENVSNELSGIDTGSIEEVANAAENASAGIDQIESAANNASQSMSSIDTSAMNDVALSAQNAAQGMDSASNASDAFGEISSALIGIGIGAFLEDAASSAGDFGDRIKRMDIIFQHSVKSSDQASNFMTKGWNDAINSVQNTTGRGMGTIQEAFIGMGQAGINSKEVLVESFDAINGAAFLKNGGRDINSITESYTNMIKTGKIGAKLLARLGISQEGVFKSTGMTIKELTEKFEKYTPEQRAATLNSILNAGGAKEANEAWKESFEHLKESSVLALGGLERSIGTFVLPILIPVIEQATNCVKWLSDSIKWLSTEHSTFTNIAGSALVLVGSLTSLLLILHGTISIFSKLNKTVKECREFLTDLPNKIRETYNRIYNWGAKLKIVGEQVKDYIFKLKELVLAKKAETAESMRGVVARARETMSTVVSTIAKGASTLATNAAAAAQWALNAAMSANPIGILIILIMGLVAVIVYLWSTNEGFRNTLVNTWNSLNSLGDSIKNGLLPAWNMLVAAGQQVINLFNRLKDAFSILTDAWNSGNGPLDSLFQSFQKIPELIGTLFLTVIDWALSIDWLGMFEGFISGMENMVNTAVSFLVNIDWSALIGSLFGSSGETAGNTLVNGVSDTASPSKFQELFTKVAQKIATIDWTGVLLKIGELMLRISLVILTAIPRIMLALVMGIGGAIWNALAAADIPEKIMNTLSSIGTAYISFLTTVWTTILNIYITVWTTIINIATSLISQLPGRLWIFLLQTIQRIGIFAISAYSKAREAGHKIITGIQSTLMSLPGKMYEWGKNAINRFINSIVDSIPGLRWALDMVSQLFPHSPPKYGPLATIKPENMYKFGAELGTHLQKGLDNTTTGIFSQIQNIQPQLGKTGPLPTVNPLKDTQYDTLKSTNMEIWNSIANTTTDKLNTMQNTMKESMDTIVTNNQDSYQNIENTTKTVLTSLQTKTKDNIGDVKHSWTGMHDSLVNAARNIRTQVSNDISTLSTNIATFYRRIRNPSLLVAGPSPQTLGPQKIHIPHISRAYAGPATNNRELSILDNLPYIPCLSEDGCYAGGWDFSKPWITEIIDRVKGYVPNFGDLGNLGLKVKDFEKTSMPLKGNLAAFTQIADQIISKTRYMFYYNSQYPTPSAALQAGAFNCYDGALIMLSLAKSMGLPGSLVHGFWGNVGHVYANIAGKTFDTTAKQHGHGWSSPKVHAGPPPYSRNVSSSPESLNINNKYEYTFKIQLEDVPTHLDETQLTNTVEEILTNSDLIKKLVKDREFQDTLQIELMKSKERARRISGG